MILVSTSRCTVPILLILLSLASVGAHAGEAAEEGIAAYYSNVFQGRKTASGARYDKNRLTAAHNHLPFGTRVRVTNLKNGESVVVTINDRGPHGGNRIIDLSRAAAEKIGLLHRGIGRVRLDIVETVAN